MIDFAIRNNTAFSESKWLLLQPKRATKNAYSDAKQEQCMFSELFHSLDDRRPSPGLEMDKEL